MSAWSMGNGLPQRRSVDAAEFRWTASNLWGCRTLHSERLPCIDKWKHCDER
ncbi:hypothetical protein F2Q68_00014894 [Brassica cretica]|uniref:Uncharacterized protein n=2 Tax=Brassica cretica TaxID=69181 RepID=A0A8S9H901_BRACR|nr:hypothetical protein F2Q68_00014894 [Brassica cretica]KAF3609868.1 hypothetical protein DY000_02047645 [Brassica cretica]